MFTLAYSDADRTGLIEIIICRDEDELIHTLMDITEIPDLYDGMSIDEALEMLDYQADMFESVSMTIVDHYGKMLYQI